MYIFDLKDIVKTPEGEYAEVIDVGQSTGGPCKSNRGKKRKIGRAHV